MLLLDSEVPVHDVDESVLTRSSNPNKPITKVEGKYIKFLHDDESLKTFIPGSKLMAKHMMALTVKRFHHSRRNKKGFICEVHLSAL